MSRASEEAYVSQTQPPTNEQPGGSSSAAPSTTINFNVLRQRQGVGVGTAVALTVGATLATVIYMRRRRGRARMGRLAWLAVRTALIRAMLPRVARGAAAVGGLGGGVLAAGVLRNRLRHSHSPSGLEELGERVAALQAQVDARGLSDRPHPRDVLLGAALGLGLAGLLARVATRRKSKSKTK
jgi:hypothetical protein